MRMWEIPELLSCVQVAGFPSIGLQHTSWILYVGGKSCGHAGFVGRYLQMRPRSASTGQGLACHREQDGDSDSLIEYLCL